MAVETVAELKRRIEKERLEWANGNISYANGLAVAQNYVSEFEAGLRGRIKNYELLMKKNFYDTYIGEIEELKRILGDGKLSPWETVKELKEKAGSEPKPKKPSEGGK